MKRLALDGTRNALHGSDSDTSAQKEISFFFGSKFGVNTASYNDTTCCVIKPHAVAEGEFSIDGESNEPDPFDLFSPGRAGQIINAILTAGFQITAIGTVNL